MAQSTTCGFYTKPSTAALKVDKTKLKISKNELTLSVKNQYNFQSFWLIITVLLGQIPFAKFLFLQDNPYI